MRIAFIHDYLTQFGGAERVLQHLHTMYPLAPIYTLLANKTIIAREFPRANIQTSFLQSFPGILRNRHLLLPLSGAAIERFDLREFDCVISSCSSFAKGVLTRPETVHICYCHTPTRYLWDNTHDVLEERSFLSRVIARPVLHWLRVWDRQAAERPTIFVANSQHTRKRINAYYGRDAVVVYPPTGWDQEGRDIDLPEGLPNQFYLVVGHLRRFKRMDVVVQALTRLNWPLVVVGEGPEERRLRKEAGPSVYFLGHQQDSSLQQLYRRAHAVIIPGEEDFGIVAVEAQWAGTPVLAYRAGGSKETILEGITGEFFDEQSPAVLVDSLRRMRHNSYDRGAIRAHGRQFPPVRFSAGMRQVIERCLIAANNGTLK